MRFIKEREKEHIINVRNGKWDIVTDPIGVKNIKKVLGAGGSHL
jgi:hypothetical protein